jgi:lysine-specific permease
MLAIGGSIGTGLFLASGTAIHQAGALLMKFWFPDVPSYIWSLLFLSVFVIFNLFSVRGFGESEFWFAFIKVLAIIIFILVGILMIMGVIGGSAVGFSNIRSGSGAFHGNYFTLFQLLIVAGFSFQGTELVGVAAGESKDPKKSLPKAVKQIFWRILLFYILALMVIGFLIPSNDPRLLGGESEWK